MTNIDPTLIRSLRERTGAGIVECKKALVEANGDDEEAVKILRKKGLAAAAKKSGRLTKEGAVGVLVQGNRGFMVELNTETDFVARNSRFSTLIHTILAAGSTQQNLSHVDEVMLLPVTIDGQTSAIADAINHEISIMGEHMSLSHWRSISVNPGVVVSYIHNSYSPSIGRIGVLIGLECAMIVPELNELGQKLAMHIAAAAPLYLREVPKAALEEEEAVFRVQAASSGKPESAILKMVEGRLRKYVQEVVLEEQTFIMDTSLAIKEVIAHYAQKIGQSIRIHSFERLAIGE